MKKFAVPHCSSMHFLMYISQRLEKYYSNAVSNNMSLVMVAFYTPFPSDILT